MDLSMYLFASMNLSNRSLTIAVKSLPTHEVRAIGLKLVGVDGSDLAVDFPISFTTASFHAEGTTEVAQQRLTMLWRATKRAGHHLKTV